MNAVVDPSFYSSPAAATSSAYSLRARLISGVLKLHLTPPFVLLASFCSSCAQRISDRSKGRGHEEKEGKATISLEWGGVVVSCWYTETGILHTMLYNIIVELYLRGVKIESNNCWLFSKTSYTPECASSSARKFVVSWGNKNATGMLCSAWRAPSRHSNPLIHHAEARLLTIKKMLESS